MWIQGTDLYKISKTRQGGPNQDLLIRIWYQWKCPHQMLVGLASPGKGQSADKGQISHNHLVTIKMVQTVLSSTREQYTILDIQNLNNQLSIAQEWSRCCKFAYSCTGIAPALAPTPSPAPVLYLPKHLHLHQHLSLHQLWHQYLHLLLHWYYTIDTTAPALKPALTPRFAPALLVTPAPGIAT